MREMKDSGIEWIGEIPKEWRITKIKREYKFQTGWTPDTKNDLNFEGDNIWVNISDMKAKIINDSAKHISDAAIKNASMNISPKKSLLFAFKLSIGAVGFCGVDLYTNEAIATFLHGTNSLRYLYYIAPVFIVKNANENIYGARILNQQLIREAKIVLPSVSEQQKLADYLEEKCSKIDEVIRKQEKIIEKLKEYRLSVITEAVTKGMNPDVEMKESGVEWIEEIPSHWRIAKLKYYSVEIGDGIHSTPEYDSEGSVFFVNGNNIGKTNLVFKEDTDTLNNDEYEKYKHPILNQNTIMIALNGATYGKLSYYNNEKILLGKSAGYITLSVDINRGFLYYYLQSIVALTIMEVSLCGSTIANLSLQTLKNFPIPVPDIGEQKSIYRRIDRKCKIIEEKIKKKEELIKELICYKKSLIYEVVTGKKEV